MTALEQVYNDFYYSGIYAMTMPMNSDNISMCSPDGFIAIDTEKCCTQNEERTALIHEDGHFISGAFYTPYSPYIIREQAEYRANISAIQKYIPMPSLKKCLMADMHLYEIAEFFSVTENFVFMAYLYYRDTNALL